MQKIKNVGLRIRFPESQKFGSLKPTVGSRVVVDSRFTSTLRNIENSIGILSKIKKSIISAISGRIELKISGYHYEYIKKIMLEAILNFLITNMFLRETSGASARRVCAWGHAQNLTSVVDLSVLGCATCGT